MFLEHLVIQQKVYEDYHLFSIKNNQNQAWELHIFISHLIQSLSVFYKTFLIQCQNYLNDGY